MPISTTARASSAEAGGGPRIWRSPSERTIAVLAWLAVAALFASGELVADPDMWHEMALFREALARGSLPQEDSFAFTPTVSPVVHHEWGSGAILYGVSRFGGAAGIVALAHLATAAMAWAIIVCARRSGARTAVLTTLAPLAVFLLWGGSSAFRAQRFTLILTAILLELLRRDRTGSRRWIVPWLLLHVLWLNLHAGFVVGVLFLGLHAVEQALKRRPVRHLLVALGLAVALVAVNPYGFTYHRYIVAAVRLDRDLITEWAPVWEDSALVFGMYLFSLVLVLYALVRRRVRDLPGLLLVLCSACAAARHQRHLSIYAVAWLAYVPAWIQGTALGPLLEHPWKTRPRLIAGVWSAALVFVLASNLVQRPWHLRVPSRPGEHRVLCYPAGAVDYLERWGFEGNVIVPFTVGAFVSWKLHPDVLVSIDGRFEVAYPPGSLQRHHDYYRAEPKALDFPAQSGAHGVLVPLGMPVAEVLKRDGDWTLAYRDDTYELFLRREISPPPEDLRGETPAGSFP